ncbi:MAG: hypothetical protein AAFZ18_02030 [Myxococcota bacterium]
MGILDVAYAQTWTWPRRAYAAFQLWPYAHGLEGIRGRLSELDGATALIGGLGLYFVAALPILQGLAVFAEGFRLLGPGRRGRLQQASFCASLLAAAVSAHLIFPGMNRDITHLAFVGDFAMISVLTSAPTWHQTSRRRTGLLAVVAVGALLPYARLASLGTAGTRDWAAAAREHTWFVDDLESLPAEARIVYGGPASGYTYFYVRAAGTPITNLPDVPQAWPGYYDDDQIAWLMDGVRAPRTEALVLTRAQRRFLRERDSAFERKFVELKSDGRFLLMARRRTKDHGGD